MKLHKQVIVQAAYTLGGHGTIVCDTTEEVIQALQECLRLSPVSEVHVKEIHIGSEEYVTMMERLSEEEPSIGE